VGKTNKHQQLILLEHDRAALLAKLAKDSKIPRQVLLREAVDLLLAKYKVLKPKRKP
jgi:Ribbon-helix-helix domain